MIDSHPKQRRRSPRRETMLAAAVSVAGQSVACTVRNISDGGALLQFDQPLCVPFSFVITIAGESAQRSCEVRHHYGVCVGVEFVSLARISEFSPAVYGGPVGNWIETEQPLSLG